MNRWSFLPIAFDNQARENLQKALERDKTASVRLLEAEVLKGKARLFGVFKNTVRTGSIILRLEEYDKGVFELVVVAAGGRVGIEGLKASYAFFDKEAIKKGAKFIRMHIVRPALFKVSTDNGYMEAERIYRKEI